MSFISRPPLIVVTGPPGSGKTRYCLDRFLQMPDAVLVVFPTAGLRASAEGTVSASPAFNDDIEFNLDSLQDWNRFLAYVMDRGSVTPPGVAGRIARVAASARVSEQGKGGYFERACGTLGFHERFADIVGELVSAGLTPDRLERAAERAEVFDPRFPAKAHDLAELWRAYDTLLARLGMTTHADLPCLALDALTTTSVPTDEIWFDGFERLAQVQVELLSVLAERCRVGITLTWRPEAAELFEGVTNLLDRLDERFDVVRVVVSDEPVRHHSRTMVSLARHLFQDLYEPKDADMPIQVVDCPTRLAEVEYAARFILRLMADEPLEIHDFALVARDMSVYWPLIEVVMPRFGIQPSRGVDKPVGENPFVRFLMSALSLFRDGWQREAVFQYISSSYAFDESEQWALRVALGGQRVEHGLHYWQGKARELADAGSAPAGKLLDLAKWAERFEGRHPSAEFAGMLREMSVEMGWTDRAGDARAPRAREDFIAVEAAHKIANAMDQIEAAGGEERMRLGAFVARWTRLCRLGRFSVPSSPGLRVVESAGETGSTPRVALVLGLLEGVFPRRLNEDPFLNDEERLELRRVTGCYLPTGLERLQDERRRFYEAVTLPSERLYLFYPRADDDSESIPTLYLDEVRRAVPESALREASVMLAPPPGLRMPSQLAPPLDLTLTGEDRLLSASAGLTEQGDPGIASRLEEWRSLPRFPRVTETDSKALAGLRKGSTSISEIETMNRCMFQHWAQYRAKLRARSDVITRADQGSLLHAVLRDALAQPGDGPLVDRLLAELERKLSTWPMEGQDWQLDLLRAYGSRLLVDFARREGQFRAAFPLKPASFEWRFGEPPAEGRQRDPDSTAKPFNLELDEMSLPLAGSIDRIDKGEDGAMLILDYKLGSAGARRIKDMEEAKSLQLPLYALAVEQLLGAELVSIGYDGLGGDQRLLAVRFGREKLFPRDLLPKGSEMRVLGEREWAKIVETATAQVVQLVGRSAEADITPNPSDETCRMCEYGDLCRTRGRRHHDGEPWDEEGEVEES